MTQGAENDLSDIRYYEVTTPVIYFRANEPFEDLNGNLLVVDAKAILARDTALAAQTDLGNHVGVGGVVAHAVATSGVAGFLSAADKVKLNGIQSEAQLNILAPVDAIELISRKETTLHEHPLATPTLDGFMSTTDKSKLDGISPSAEVNNITPAQVATLTGGGNADSLHGHGFSVGTESFTALVHSTTNHAGLPGVEAFPGFTSSGFLLGPYQWLTGVNVHSVPYGFTTLETVSIGLAETLDVGSYGASESFRINDVAIVGTTCTVTFEVDNGGGTGDMLMRTWQVGYGI